MKISVLVTLSTDNLRKPLNSICLTNIFTFYVMTEQADFSPRKVSALFQKVNYLTSYYQNKFKHLEGRVLELEAVLLKNDLPNADSRSDNDVKSISSDAQSSESVNIVPDSKQDTVKLSEKVDTSRPNILCEEVSSVLVGQSRPDCENKLFSQNTKSNVCGTVYTTISSNDAGMVLAKTLDSSVSVNEKLNLKRPTNKENTSWFKVECDYENAGTSNVGNKKRKLDDRDEKIENNRNVNQEDVNRLPYTNAAGGSDTLCPQNMEYFIPLLFDSDHYAKVYIYLLNVSNSNIVGVAWFNKNYPYNVSRLFTATNKVKAGIILTTDVIASFKEIYFPKFKKLCIHTCFECLLKLYSELPRYEKDYFRKEDGKPLKYSKELINLTNIIKGIEVRMNLLDTKNTHDIGVRGIQELVHSHQSIY